MSAHDHSTHNHDHNEHAHQSHVHHDHHHENHSHNTNQRLLWIAFILIAGFMLVEVIGGYVTGSLALLSDAGHMFSDAVALGMTLLAFKIGTKTANAQNTFGYKRFEILVAAINGLTLVVIALLILYEAIIRLQHPPEIASLQMLIISGIGLVINLIVAKLLHGGDTHNLNMKSAYLHVLSDLLGSVAAIVAAVLMMAFGWVWADAVASLIVAILILHSGYGVVKSAGHILMEGSPATVPQDNIINALRAHPQVLMVHDMHIWSLTSGVHFLSCHVVVQGNLTIQQTDIILAELNAILAEQNIAHSTIQIESDSHQHATDFVCEVHKLATSDEHLGHTH